MAISPITCLLETPSIQSLIQHTGTILSVSSRITRLFRQAEAPHLFALGEGLQNMLPNDRILNVTAQIVSIAYTLLAVGQSLQEVQYSWNQLTSIRLIPSPSAILFMSAARNSSLVQETIQIYSDRLLYSLQNFYTMLWHVWITALKIYDLACTLCWTEETARTSQGDIFLNLQECGRILFDPITGSWQELIQTIEPPMTKLLTSFGAHKTASSLLSITKSGLEYIEVLYRHLPSSRSFAKESRGGYHLALQTVIGIP